MLADQCQYFLPALFRNPDFRPALEQWFKQTLKQDDEYGTRRLGVFAEVGNWLFGSLAPHLERRTTAFLSLHRFGDFGALQRPLRVCAQNRFPHGVAWWTDCIQKLSQNKSGARIFAATIERGTQFGMSQNLLWMEEILQNPVYLNLPKESPYWWDIGGFKWCKITSIHRSFLQLVGFWTFDSSLAV